MKTFSSKLIIFLGVFFLIMGTMTSFGMNESYAVSLEIIGNNLGLEVTPSGTKLFELTNLNPGDTNEEKIDIKNNHTLPFKVLMRAERMSPQPETGEADLFEQLILTVYLDGVKIYTGPMKNYAINNISLGNFNPNTGKELKAVVYLPGPETGNEFQGASLEVKWIFIATLEQDDEDEPTRPTGPPESNEPGEIIEIIKEEIPQGVPEPPKEETIEEEETPKGTPESPGLPEEETPKDTPELPDSSDLPEEEILEEEVPLGTSNLPKTGEISSTVYYILGIALIGLGIGTGAKKKDR